MIWSLSSVSSDTLKFELSKNNKIKASVVIYFRNEAENMTSSRAHGVKIERVVFMKCKDESEVTEEAQRSSRRKKSAFSKSKQSEDLADRRSVYLYWKDYRKSFFFARKVPVII